MELHFESDIRIWPSEKAAWWFFTLPFEVAEQVRFAHAGRPKRGFGSVRVEDTLGQTSWRTSLFPNKADQNYLLPVKAAVRKAQSVVQGPTYLIHIRLLEV